MVIILMVLHISIISIIMVVISYTPLHHNTLQGHSLPLISSFHHYTYCFNNCHCLEGILISSNNRDSIVIFLSSHTSFVYYTEYHRVTETLSFSHFISLHINVIFSLRPVQVNISPSFFAIYAIVTLHQ